MPSSAQFESESFKNRAARRFNDINEGTGPGTTRPLRPAGMKLAGEKRGWVSVLKYEGAGDINTHTAF